MANRPTPERSSRSTPATARCSRSAPPRRFNPNKFAKPLTKAEYASLEGRAGGSEEAPAPLTDRAVNGTYPTGSTFKPITAMGALEAGVINPTEGLGAGQCISVSTEQFCNAGMADYGAVGLVEALKVSSDTYFFEVGELANSHGNVIQKMAHELGVGQPTGIDLPSEFQGVVPDRPGGPSERARARLRASDAQRLVRLRREVRPWSVGDNMHLAVGQGDLLTSPLQMAVAYSTLANAYMNGGEGTVVRPHLGMEIDDSQGRSRPGAALPAGPPRPPQRRISGPRDAGHPRGGEPAGGHLGRCLGGLGPGAAPGVRKDGHR